MAARRKNHEGKKYHHLTMLKPVRSGGAGKGMYWLAQCDCGTTREVRASEAALGYVKTCGKCQYHLALVQGAGAKGGHKFSQNNGRNRGLREQERRYIYSAMKRSIPWHLTPREFEHIVKQPCTYCQAEPREYKARLKKGKGRQVSALMNGIDRVDSSKGYTLDNCISCCTTCNRMKLDLPIVDFIKQCTKVSVLFDKYMKLLKETAEAEGKEHLGEYDQLQKDLLAIQYGYRHSPIQHNVSDTELNAIYIELSQVLPRAKARLEQTGKFSKQDLRIDKESDWLEGQELSDVIDAFLKEAGSSKEPEPSIENTNFVQYGEHAAKITQVQLRKWLEQKKKNQ